MPELGHRTTKIAFALIAIAAVAWYLTADHRYQRSLVPLALLISAVLAKLVGMVVTFGGVVVGGSDFGIMLFLSKSVVHIWQFATTGAVARGAPR